MSKYLINGLESSPSFIFAHGAGAPMDSDFMELVTHGLVNKGIRVIRFEFDYMDQQRISGKRRPPDRQPKLLAAYHQVLNDLDLPNAVIGGKSMGGRMATLLACERAVPGVAVLGYPFHPIGKPARVRIEHLPELTCPVLICQGERDSMGTKDEVAQYRLPENIQLSWFGDGDHDLKPRKSSGFNYQDHLDLMIEQLSQFIFGCYEQSGVSNKSGVSIKSE